MIGPLLAAALVAGTPVVTPRHLPALPKQGIALSESGGITFVDLAGKRIGRIAGLRFAQDHLPGLGSPRFRDSRGRLWRLDPGRRRFVAADDGVPLAGGASLAFERRTWLVRRGPRVLLRMRVGREFPFLSDERDIVSTSRRALDLRTGRRFRLPRGCVGASRRLGRWILLCGRTTYGTVLPTRIEEWSGRRRRRIAASPFPRASDGRIHGHWAYALLSPDGRTLLGQWSGECESPTAFLVSRAHGRPRPAGAATADKSLESEALGWTPGGTALVHFTAGICGAGYRGGPGIYALPAKGKPRLILSTRPRQVFQLWR